MQQRIDFEYDSDQTWVPAGNVEEFIFFVADVLFIMDEFDFESDQTWVPTGNIEEFYVATAEDVQRGKVDFDAQMEDELLYDIPDTDVPPEARSDFPLGHTVSEPILHEIAENDLTLKINTALYEYNASIARRAIKKSDHSWLNATEHA